MIISFVALDVVCGPRARLHLGDSAAAYPVLSGSHWPIQDIGSLKTDN
jgi:hypothetical protein